MTVVSAPLVPQLKLTETKEANKKREEVRRGVSAGREGGEEWEEGRGEEGRTNVKS